MVAQILQYLKKVNRPVDICEASEVVRQRWSVTSYGFGVLIRAGLVEALPNVHPTYQLTAQGEAV